MLSASRIATAAHTVRVRRYAAAFLDGLLAITIALLPASLPFGVYKGRVFGIGLVLGTVYLLLRDGIPYAEWGARSLGKRWLGVRPYRVSHAPMDWRTSAKRNATVAAAFGIPAVAYVLGGYRGFPLDEYLWIAAIVLAIVEIVLIAVDPVGRRLGDRWADTRVTEARA